MASLDGIKLALQSAERLAKMVKPSGKFVYRYKAASGEPITCAYNMLRHSGSVWALNVARQAGAQDLAEPARRAMDWLVRHHIVRVPQGGAYVDSKGNFKLGGNALAILAFASLADFSDSDRALVEDLCRYVWSQVNERGEFIHKRDAKTGEISTFRSSYYDGEALFALLVAGEKLADTAMILRTKHVLLANARRGLGIDDQSQWMMYAAETCQRLSPHPDLMIYAEKVVDDIFKRPSYRDGDKSTRIACRTEALLSYLRMAPHPPLYLDARQKRAWRTIKENIDLELLSRLPDGAFCQDPGKTIVRNDYLQHNLVALLGYGRLSRIVREGQWHV